MPLATGFHTAAAIKIVYNDEAAGKAANSRVSEEKSSFVSEEFTDRKNNEIGEINHRNDYQSANISRLVKADLDSS